MHNSSVLLTCGRGGPDVSGVPEETGVYGQAAGRQELRYCWGQRRGSVLWSLLRFRLGYNSNTTI